MSSNKCSSGKSFACVFHQCHLSVRGRSICELEVLRCSDYINPCAALSRQVGGATSLSKAQRSKQWYTGRAFWDGVRSSVLGRMNLSSSDGVIWVDLFSYDDKLQQSVIQCHCRQNVKQPNEAVISTVWATMGVTESKTDDKQDKVDNARIEAFLKKSLCLFTSRLIKEKVLKFEDLDVDMATTATQSQRPTFDPAAYTQTCPNANKELPIRQDVLDLMSAKLKSDAAKQEFDKIVKDHNKEFNPSGVPYKGEKKRPGSEVEGQDDDEAKDAKTYPDDDSCPKSRDRRPGRKCFVGAEFALVLCSAQRKQHSYVNKSVSRG